MMEVLGDEVARHAFDEKSYSNTKLYAYNMESGENVLLGNYAMHTIHTLQLYGDKLYLKGILATITFFRKILVHTYLHCLAAHKIINFRKSDSSVICLSLALDQITLITFSEALLACHVFLSTKQQKVYSSFLLASYCVSFLVCNKKYRQYEVQQQDDAHIVGKISIR